MNTATRLTAAVVTVASFLLGSGYGPELAAGDVSEVYYKGEPLEDASLEEFRQWRQDTREERCRWWRHDRFGMFVHWGVYAVPAGTYNGKRIGGIGEWIMNRGKIPVDEYRRYAKKFNPVKYDPDKWVRMAKNAGMKYIVITSKHHDGFALFDSKVTEWDIVDATPYGKDLLAPLAEACRKHGIKLGFYYSQAQDWNHPGGAAAGGHWDEKQDGDMDKYIEEIAAPQVREILTNYGPLGILWWDTPVGMNAERAKKLYPLVKLQPHIITNNRLGGGFGGDYGTPEQHIPGRKSKHYWETCMTMNNTWGYKSYDKNWKPTKTLIRNLVDIVSKDGNYLLNVGPKADGTIPAASIERMEEIGRWMDINGESVYGCGAAPWRRRPAWGRITAGNGVLYLHVFNAPKDRVLELRGIDNRVKKARLLADSAIGALKVTSSDSTVKIALRGELPDDIDTVVAVEYEGELSVSEVPVGETNGAVELQAADVRIHGTSARFQQDSAGGNIGYWTNADDWVEWVFKPDRPGAFDVEIVYACANESGGSTYEVTVGDETLKGKIDKTGGWNDFVTEKLGRIKIEKTGKLTLSVKPVKKPGLAVMNLRTVRLKRVK